MSLKEVQPEESTDLGAAPSPKRNFTGVLQKNPVNQSLKRRQGNGIEAGKCC